MNIQTKYNIGDEVWWCNTQVWTAPKKGIIDVAQTSTDKDGTRIHYFLVDVAFYFKESELFPTKEELLKSLNQ